jgi:hypothetical protein
MHLEQYPHITKRIETLWGTRDCRKFLLELIADSRDGSRKGLPPEVAKEILLLIESHDADFPGFDDSQDYVKTTYQFMPREAPAVGAGDGVVMKLLVRMSAYGVGLALLVEAYKRLS